ncbi:CpaF family protein [Geobacillus icigianus]|uniref:Type II secretion system protein E n=1 Tax=Geobacillus subterraneus TaxID=129338 RepID=A0A679FYS4_9BACL|nr:CpaF family protein [Geobacillus subterraneus]BBW97984.1 type II secretion system protein E [Geobacillus subterraneus]
MRIEEAIKKKQFFHSESIEATSSFALEQNEKVDDLKYSVRQKILSHFGEEPELLHQPEKLKQLVWKAFEEEYEANYVDLLLDTSEKRLITGEIVRNLIGFGVIDPLIRDEEITEIMINGTKDVFIERRGRISRALTEEGIPIQFESEADILNLVEKIVAPINRKIDESDPIVDARLPDGSRVNVVIRPVSLNGPVVTIRKFPSNPYTMEDLVQLGALDQKIAEWLSYLVKARYNIIVSGGTGSGKTTFLNALSMFIPRHERIITVEDAAELKVSHIENLVRLETRPPNIENKGMITIRDLVKTALRMRPDRIIVGEVRSGEALDMLQAMNTGHDGSLTTGHANSSMDMLSRLETMVLMSGLELPLPAIRRQIASAVEFIIHLGRMRDGSRKVIQISEVRDFRNGEIECVDLFKWKTTHVGENGTVFGRLESTGNVVKQMDKWASLGISQSINDIFDKRVMMQS